MAREYMQSTLLNKRIIWLLALASIISVSVYLIVSAIYYRIGFPLDDSWIHLTYARNLAIYGEWAFQPGRPSAGSTSPLWTGLLSLGFFFKLAPYIWTYLLGTLLLWGMGLVGEAVVRSVSPAYQTNFPWVGLFLILEWHMAWSAVSGMETLMHALLITIVLGMMMSGSRRFLTLGLLTGLSVWVRPDGITLLGPVVVYILVTDNPMIKRWKDLSQFIIGFGSLLVPYLLFNLVLSGTPMPNTFYAKQAEYAAWQARPLIARFGELSLQFMAGPSVALLPGAIGWFVISLRKRDWGTLAGMVWFAGYLYLYIERLPVYQHGRYIMPAMPIFFVWGLCGLIIFTASINMSRLHWSVSTGWTILTAILGLTFWLIGAKTYAEDVSLIESEMVTSAKWVAKNVPADEAIAVHDIGALGYYDNHTLIDLAGIITPEIIPFIKDEEKLAHYMDEQNVSYLIAFLEFYPLLEQRAEPAFVTDGFAPKFGGNNMIVYHWR